MSTPIFKKNLFIVTNLKMGVNQKTNKLSLYCAIAVLLYQEAHKLLHNTFFVYNIKNCQQIQDF